MSEEVNGRPFDPKQDMKSYTGTKTLKGWKTTKGWYNDYQGWKIPEDQDPNEEIYLVEYPVEEDTIPNHPDHEGYISMSPKTVFEKYYSESGTYIDRLKNEHNDLSEKINKLRNALVEKLVPDNQREILTSQLEAMTVYLDILAKRLS